MLFFEVKVTVVCVSWVIIISQKIRYAFSWLHTGVSSVLHAGFPSRCMMGRIAFL